MLKDEKLSVIENEFKKKTEILNEYGEWVDGFTLYEDMFGDLDRVVPVVLIDDDETKHMMKMTVDEALDYSENRNDILLGGCTYFKGFVSKATAKDIYAFIIDMDNVWAGVLKTALMNDWNTEKEELPMPTYIVNSGTGLHLYYLLKDPIPHYKCNAENIDQLYRALAIQQTTKRIYLQKQVQWFGQDFRMAGSLNKYDWHNEVFKVGEKWDIDDLGKAVGLKDIHFVHYGEQKQYQKAAKKAPKRTKGSGWLCNRGFYDYTLERCREETKEGSRYMSFCALAVIAWKCNVPIDEVERDLIGLIPKYNEGATRQIKEKEVQHALKMYNEKAMLTQRERLQDWIGWEYKPIKRNGRNRELHLKIARATRDILHPEGWQNRDGRPKGNSKQRECILNYRKGHPDAKPMDCVADTGISRNTVYRWWNNE